MKFASYTPTGVLQPFVRSLVISETDGASTYKVLPDTGLVIGFQYKGQLSYLNNDKPIHLSASGVTGLGDSFRMFQHTDEIGSVLVFFKEGAAAHFFKTPVHELFRESVSLDNFLLRSELLLLEEQLQAAKEDLKRISIVEKFLVSQLRNDKTDVLVLAAVSLIHKTKGNIRISDLIKELHISQSPLEKRFRQVIGASPKKFASIVRMKHALRAYQPGNSLTALGYEAGFYDQAHFIKEFKRFTGETPEKFLPGE